MSGNGLLVQYFNNHKCFPHMLLKDSILSSQDRAESSSLELDTSWFLVSFASCGAEIPIPMPEVFGLRLAVVMSRQFAKLCLPVREMNDSKRLSLVRETLSTGRNTTDT